MTQGEVFQAGGTGLLREEIPVEFRDLPVGGSFPGSEGWFYLRLREEAEIETDEFGDEFIVSWEWAIVPPR